jgi:alpha-methylacyl-CoA racemase
MIDGSLSLMAMHLPLWKTAHLAGRGDGLLAGDKPFYRSYACSDGRFVAVGALERQFFEALWRKLDLGDVPDHMSRSAWPAIERTLSATFATRPRDAWAAFFAGGDACVTPVLDPDEIWGEPHLAGRHPGAGAERVPAVPRFGRTPSRADPLDMADQTEAVLRELGLSDAAVEAAVGSAETAAPPGLSWPPVLRP